MKKQTPPTTPKAPSSLTRCREAPTRREIVSTERTTRSLGGSGPFPDDHGAPRPEVVDRPALTSALAMARPEPARPDAGPAALHPRTGLPVVAMVGGGQLARMTHQAAIALGQSL